MYRILFLLLFMLTGCASTVSPNITSNYAGLKQATPITVTPSFAVFPKARVVESDGVKYMGFTAVEGDQILEYRNASKNNREALSLLVAAVNDNVAERNLLVLSLQLEEARKNEMAIKYADAENGRRYEQRERVIETTVYKAILVIIGLFAL